VIPSAIRAYLIQEKITEGGTEAMDCGCLFARAFEPTFKLFDGLAHRKFSALTVDRRNEPFCCAPPHIVQSAIQIVDCIPQHDGEIPESFRVCELMYEAFCAELRVNLNTGSITVMKSDDACFNIADMLVGTLNF